MNFKRVVVYIEEQQYRKLKSKLALLGLSVSAWVREKIDEFLKEKHL